MSLRQLSEWIHTAKQFFVFSGAGMSTESGIPDFRSPTGIWAKYTPVYFDEFMRSETARKEYWRQKTAMHQEFADAKPNKGHNILARWESQGVLQGVVTQNIDGLHQLAGSQHVIEIHGTARVGACMVCGKQTPIEPLVQQFLETSDPPDCECGGPMKHATISFGQSLEPAVLSAAQTWMEQADLVIAMGSSLVVHPAAGLPQFAVERGARLVIINRDETPLDGLADLVLHGDLGETLTRVDELL